MKVPLLSFTEIAAADLQEGGKTRLSKQFSLWNNIYAELGLESSRWTEIMNLRSLTAHLFSSR